MDDSEELKTLRFRKLSFKLDNLAKLYRIKTAGGSVCVLADILDFHCTSPPVSGREAEFL